MLLANTKTPMAKLTLQHPQTGIIKTAPLGFSWTTLFFGALPALFRGDFKWFLIQALLSIFILPTLIFPFVYNRIFLRQLLERGFKVQSTGGKKIEDLNARLGLRLPVLEQV